MRSMKACNAAVTIFLMIMLFIYGCSKEKPTAPRITIQQEFQRVLEEVFSAHDGRGISVAVVLPGEDVWVGTSNMSGSSSITPDMFFWIASVTKTYTATVILQLIEEGMITFEDQLHQFLPTYQYIDSTITIEQLLKHTSGVFEYTQHPLYNDMMEEDRSKIWTPEELITRMILEPYFDPGEGRHYSSTNYILLGMIIKEVTGNQLSEEFRTRIYEPLTLDHTFLDAEESIPGEFAYFWADFDDDGVEEEIPVLSVERYSETSTAWASGGLFSTAEDVGRFIHALFRGDLLGSEMLSEMLDFTMDIPNPGWGVGIAVVLYPPSINGGIAAYGNSGNAAFYIADTVYLPDYNVSITILQNEARWDLQYSLREELCKIIRDFYE